MSIKPFKILYIKKNLNENMKYTNLTYFFSDFKPTKLYSNLI